MASNFQFCPNVDELTADSPAPVQADAQGRYPAPVPGHGRKSEARRGQTPRGLCVSFSKEGLCMLLAAVTGTGLDPVDAGQKRGGSSEKDLRIPCAVLPGGAWFPCNAQWKRKADGNWANQSLFALRVRDATHCVLEQPTDWLA